MKSILLIEDEQKMSLEMGVSLTEMGYEVSTAGDAISALAEARKYSPDIVLVDISLPSGEGLLVAERLHALLLTALTPLIFIAASNQPGLKERAEELGAIAFLEKPFDVSLLTDAIEGSEYVGLPTYVT